VLPAAVVLRSTFRLHTHARAHAHTQAPTKPRFQKFHKFTLDLPGTPCNPAGGRIIRRVMTSPPLVPFFSFFLPPPLPSSAGLGSLYPADCACHLQGRRIGSLNLAAYRDHGQSGKDYSASLRGIDVSGTRFISVERKESASYRSFGVSIRNQSPMCCRS